MEASVLVQLENVHLGAVLLSFFEILILLIFKKEFNIENKSKLNFKNITKVEHWTWLHVWMQPLASPFQWFYQNRTIFMGMRHYVRDSTASILMRIRNGFFLYCHRVLESFQLESIFLEPQEKHQTALYAEPLTGLILKAAKRLQLSYRFSPGATADVPALSEGGIIPLYIVEQTFEANRKREITSSRLTSEHFITKPWENYTIKFNKFRHNHRP